MERGGRRSGESQGVLIKKRSSSCCLIVKKKDGVGRFCSFSESNPNWESKKRSRLIMSDSESSGKLTITQYGNVEDIRFGWNMDWVERKMDDFFVGKSREWKESKKHRLDDDDESEDELVAMRMRRSFDGSGVGIRREYVSGSSSKDLGIEKKRKLYLDGSGNKCKVRGNESKTNKQNKMGGLLQNVEAEHSLYGSNIQESGKICVAIQSPTTMPKLLPLVRIQSNGLKTPTNLTKLKSNAQDQDSDDSDNSGQQ